MAAIAGIVAIGLLASLRLPATSISMAALSAALQVGLAALVLNLLLASAASATRDSTVGEPATGSPARRVFLLQALGLGALAIVGGGFGRRMLEGRAAQATTAGSEIPAGRRPGAAGRA